MQQALIQNGTTFADQGGQQWLGFSFKRKKADKRDIAIAYFQLLSAFNNLKLSEGEINLLAHIALNKGIVSGPCKIGYVEIVDQNGRVQNQEKIRVQNGLASGAIEIPETIASGNYIVRGYTLWSKNNQLAQACVQPIHILNSSDKNIYQYKSQNVLSNKSQDNNASLSFNGLNSKYTSKSNIAFSISNNEASPSNLITGSLTIFKVDSIQPEMLNTYSINSSNSLTTIVVPELVGHRISGTIHIKGSNVLINERVYISIPGNSPSQVSAQLAIISSRNKTLFS